ncbi:hypothetical protein ALC53_06138, partial [Atta colombica]
ESALLQLTQSTEQCHVVVSSADAHPAGNNLLDEASINNFMPEPRRKGCDAATPVTHATYDSMASENMNRKTSRSCNFSLGRLLTQSRSPPIAVYYISRNRNPMRDDKILTSLLPVTLSAIHLFYNKNDNNELQQESKKKFIYYLLLFV